jgi:hypothetical protein
MQDVYRQSRWWAFWTLHWLSMLFPNKIIVNPTYLETFKRRGMILFWMTDEERLSSNQIASVRVKKGMFWDIVSIDTKGVNSLDLRGLKKSTANKVRNKLQMIIEAQ